MSSSDLEKHIKQTLASKYGYTLNDDDPLLLMITAQAEATRHIIQIQTQCIEDVFSKSAAEFDYKIHQLEQLLKKPMVNKEKTKTFIEQVFSDLSNNYRDKFVSKEEKMIKNTKKVTVVITILTVLNGILFLAFLSILILSR